MPANAALIFRPLPQEGQAKISGGACSAAANDSLGRSLLSRSTRRLIILPVASSRVSAWRISPTRVSSSGSAAILPAQASQLSRWCRIASLLMSES